MTIFIPPKHAICVFTRYIDRFAVQVRFRASVIFFPHPHIMMETETIQLSNVSNIVSNFVNNFTNILTGTFVVTHSEFLYVPFCTFCNILVSAPPDEFLFGPWSFKVVLSDPRKPLTSPFLQWWNGWRLAVERFIGASPSSLVKRLTGALFSVPSRQQQEQQQQAPPPLPPKQYSNHFRTRKYVNKRKNRPSFTELEL